VYSYDVLWEDSKIEWACRWDAYVGTSGSVHWFFIFNSMLLVLVMIVIVAVILMRTCRCGLVQ
jgi:transmembrane 9 superfamily member 2/4